MKLTERGKNKWAEIMRNYRLTQNSLHVARAAHPEAENSPVAFFVASTRLTNLSLNAAFNYLSACGVQLKGTPVVYFACLAGMSRCVLGVNKDHPEQPPPCKDCIALSRRIFGHAPAIWFQYHQDEALLQAIDGLSVNQVCEFQYPLKLSGGEQTTIPLGELTLPSLRWALRLHTLADDEPTRFLFKQFILSAWNIATQFTRFIAEIQPQDVVVFNGVLFPEGTARWIAQQHGLRVITHEVGFQPFSGFFTDGEATAYPLDIPQDYILSDAMNARLDSYLQKRFQGEFTMAGIRFWPEMRGLDEPFNQKASRFRQIVSIFTNVIYDTSQVHANTVFTHMFAWLDMVLKIIKQHPDTLFVIRAHPDEMRPGKQSRESVPDWVEQNEVLLLPNVIFVESREYLSSYELIQRSKFVMVYNSSIGLEAVLLGKAVLCGGQARYSSYQTVYFPQSPAEYYQLAEQFMASDTEIIMPSEFIQNARRFMYFQLFRSSLSFEQFLETGKHPGFVQLKKFPVMQLKPENTLTIQAVVDGILENKPFLIPET
jgi:Capsule polysaccharide biosynthesis protein